jgi:hypothetical protein
MNQEFLPTRRQLSLDLDAPEWLAALNTCQLGPLSHSCETVR